MRTATVLKWEEKQLKIKVIIVPKVIQDSIYTYYIKKHRFVLVTTDTKNC